MQSPLLATLVNSRITFVIVLLVGMAMCTAGIGKAARLGLWVHPLSIAGYILGALALLLALQAILRLTIVPVSNGFALASIFAIVVVKVLLATRYPA